MKKQAVGLPLNGKDLRMAHLVLDGAQIRIDALDSASLPAVFEDEMDAQSEVNDSPDLNELDGIDADVEGLSDADSNNQFEVAAQLVHSLIENYSKQKLYVGLNLSATDVSYEEASEETFEEEPETGILSKFGFRKKNYSPSKREIFLPRRDKSNLKATIDSSTPFLLSLLEQQNEFFKTKLFFSLLQPNELALLNLCKRFKRIEPGNTITVIIQVEEDFSHIIFLRGDELLWVTPFFTEFEGEGLYNILYSKLIYELDHWQIDKIDSVFLCSKAACEEALAFFQERLPSTLVDYIISADANPGFVSPYSYEMLSQYALAISLAWDAISPLDRNNNDFNVLPQRFLDSQKFFKLSPTGVILLFLLGAATIVSTWTILSKKYKNTQVANEISFYEMEIKANEPIVAKVEMLTEKIGDLVQSTTLADSLIKSYDAVLNFLRRANTTLAVSSDVWINQIGETESGFNIVGQCRDRELIPRIANTLGHGVIKHLYREYESEPVYSFEIDLAWPSESLSLPAPARGPKPLMASDAGQDSRQTDTFDGAEKDGLPHYDVNSSLARSDLPASLPNLQEAPKSNRRGPVHYTILLERARDYDTAVDFISQIKQAGYDAFLQQASDEYFICTETFDTRLDAEQKLLRLKQQNIASARLIELDENGARLVDVSSDAHPTLAKMENQDRIAENSEPMRTPASEDTAAPQMEFADADALSEPDSNLLFVGENSSGNTAQAFSPEAEVAAGDSLLADTQATLSNDTMSEFQEAAQLIATYNDIQGDVPLGPPAPEAELLAAIVDPKNSPILPAEDSLSADVGHDSSLMSLDKEDYFFSTEETQATNNMAEVSSNKDMQDVLESPLQVPNKLTADSETLQRSAQEESGSQEPAPETNVPKIVSRLTNRPAKIFVLAGQFYYSRDALQESEKLRENNIESIILDLRAQGKVRPYWVCIGEFQNFIEAKEVAEWLKEYYEQDFKVKVIKSSFVVPLTPATATL